MSPSVVASETITESTRTGVAPAMFQIFIAFPTERTPSTVRAPHVVVYATLPTTQSSAVKRSETIPRPSVFSARDTCVIVVSPPASIALLSHAVMLAVDANAAIVARDIQAIDENDRGIR